MQATRKLNGKKLRVLYEAKTSVYAARINEGKANRLQGGKVENAAVINHSIMEAPIGMKCCNPLTDIFFGNGTKIALYYFCCHLLENKKICFG